MTYLRHLLERVTREGDCLVCHLTPSQVYANIKGYGKAHRFVWEQVHGAIPNGMFVCHTCDTPRCVNIDHLFLGTPQDNMTDKMKKGRGGKAGPEPQLTTKHWPFIVEMRYDDVSYEEIGNALLVSRRTVKRLLESCPHD